MYDGSSAKPTKAKPASRALCVLRPSKKVVRLLRSFSLEVGGQEVETEGMRAKRSKADQIGDQKIAEAKVARSSRRSSFASAALAERQVKS